MKGTILQGEQKHNINKQIIKKNKRKYKAKNSLMTAIIPTAYSRVKADGYSKLYLS